MKSFDAAIVQHLLVPETKDLGGFTARRLLPSDVVPMVGPFIFFDHMGPAVFPPGQGIDVRPHPHINLATVTYLFEGAILHRDSLGTVQEIQPGAVNWMTAGRGIVHSERSPEAERQRTANLHGIQTWLALPPEHEEAAPGFCHHPSASLPTWEDQGAQVKVIAGNVYGHHSPVQTFSSTLYLDVQFPEGGQFTIPPEVAERGVYSVTTGLALGDSPLPQHRLAVLAAAQPVTVMAEPGSRCVVIGGDPVGPRIKWWNFVSSRRDRILQAKADWRSGRFDPVPTETEFIPLPADEAVLEVDSGVDAANLV